MALYFMHLRDGSEELLDPDGKEFPNLAAALRDSVFATARDLLMGDVRDGLLDLRFRIDAEDESGTIVHTLAFKHALNFIPEGASPPKIAEA